jgi:hypothetical protein
VTRCSGVFVHVCIVCFGSRFTSFSVEMLPTDVFPGGFMLSPIAQRLYDTTIGADIVFNETTRPQYEKFAMYYGTHFSTFRQRCSCFAIYPGIPHSQENTSCCCISSCACVPQCAQ